MRYVKAKYKEKQEELAYRIYVTDTLYYQSDNKRLTKRYLDLISKPQKKDTRTGDEIAVDVINRLGLKV